MSIYALEIIEHVDERLDSSFPLKFEELPELAFLSDVLVVYHLNPVGF